MPAVLLTATHTHTQYLSHPLLGRNPQDKRGPVEAIQLLGQLLCLYSLHERRV